MIHVDRVLFPTDGSTCAERARRHAVHLAHQFDAALHVVRVEEQEASASRIDVREAAAREESEAAEPPTSIGSPRVRERTVLHSSPTGGILTYAVEYDTHLIVLGTHGRRGIRRLVFGSVAEAVVRRAPCPVVTVGRGAEAPHAMEGGHMLVPVDGSEHQDRLVAHAREIARAYGMQVTLLHVVEGRRGAPGESSETASLRDPSETVLERAEDLLRGTGVEATVETREGTPADKILEGAEEMDADFVTIATHGRTGLRRVLVGSVAETVIRRAPCPVCTVKAFGTSLVGEEPE